MTSVPRRYVFVLQNGAYVVRLTGHEVRDLCSGQVSAYEQEEFGRAITDGELEELQAAGYVEAYSVERVELPGSLDVIENESRRVQAYYIATTLPASQLDSVRAVLPRLPLTHILHALAYDGLIAICKPGGEPFPTLHDAEEVRRQIVRGVPDLFGQSFVAAYEVSLHDPKNREVTEGDVETRTEVAVVEPKRMTADQTIVFVEGASAQEGKSPRAALAKQPGLTVLGCVSGEQALPLIEDTDPAMIIVNLQLPDMHGWAFIKKLREIPAMAEKPLIVISDEADDMMVALKVVRARAFFLHPVDVVKLRRKVHEILEGGGDWI